MLYVFLLLSFFAFNLGVQGLRKGLGTAWHKHIKDRQSITSLPPLQQLALAGAVAAFGGLAVQHGVPEAILNLLGKQCLCLICVTYNRPK